MKKIYKTISLFLAICLLFCNCIVVVRAESTNWNETCISETIELYFAQRASFLRKERTDIPTANLGILDDETTHRNSLVSENIEFVSSDIVIDSILIGTYAEVIVLETSCFLINGNYLSENIEHIITVYDVQGHNIIGSDDYYENTTQFYSCSSTAIPTVSNYAVQGGSLCIVNIAKGEVGYAETGTNVTKYGEWYEKNIDSSVPNGSAWCVIFLAWCANQAKISTSIFPALCDTNSFKTFFVNKGSYISKSSTPQIGDVVFKGTSTPSHVGIVYKVDSSYVYYVHGNSSANNVAYGKASRSASDVLGYGRPNYIVEHENTLGWKTDTNNHWHYCNICGVAYGLGIHVFTQASNGKYVCSECGYTTSNPVTASIG